MCGIAGIVMAPGAPPPSPATLDALTQALSHRGPDGAGHFVVGRTALLQTRLAIIDVAGGDQPFFSGSATLIANGAVYNYRELRDGMPGVHFATHCDCEPPLHLWQRDGAGYAQALRGMFAIAIHERAQRSVTLTRDPFGIKPLYIAHIDGGLAFASEAQALLAAGLVRRTLRPAAREELLQMQFTTGADTIFQGIERLLPGETLRIADGHIVDRSRIAALPEGGPEDITEDAALARLDDALMESVDLHQRSDVPYGMFLSGGVDSAAVLAVMARLNNRPVLAFTAGFAAPGAADERDHAATIARAAGARHETMEITEAMVWRDLPRIVAAMDDPAADYAIIPSWFLAQRARQEVKVVLCGEGGDEIFGGYGRYRSAMRSWWLGGRVMRARGAFDTLDVLRARPADDPPPATGAARDAGATVREVGCDLSRLADVRAAAATVRDLLDRQEVRPLRAFVANAGISGTDTRRASADGYELTFAVNHLAHAQLIGDLLGCLTPPARIVLLGSNTYSPSRAARMMGIPAADWTDPEDLARPAPPDSSPNLRAAGVAYSNSKLAAIYFAHALQRHVGDGIAVTVFEPGWMPGTGLSRDQNGFVRGLMKVFQKLPGTASPASSAPALAALAVDDTWAGARDGAFIVVDKEVDVAPLAHDPEREARLWDATAELLERAAKAGAQ